MRFQVISLFVIISIFISPSAFAYEPLSATQCLKREQTPSRLQSLIHKTIITTYEGEEECRGIVSGKIDGDCRSTFKRHVINKGRECGHKGTNKEVYDAYKDRANKIYGFRGGLELEINKNKKKVKMLIGCTAFSITKNIVVTATHCLTSYTSRSEPNYGKFTEKVKKSKLYFIYQDRNNKEKRVRIKIKNYKIIGRDPAKSIILFNTVTEIQRDYFVQLMPRYTSYDDLKAIIVKQKITETYPRLNGDWIKKYGKKGIRKLYSKCPPGDLFEIIDGYVYAHQCDMLGGSSGAPITTAGTSFCIKKVKEVILFAVDMFDTNGSAYNSARPIGGSDLEAIYKFIDRVK